MLKELFNKLISKFVNKDTTSKHTAFKEQTRLEDTFILKKTGSASSKKPVTKSRPTQKKKKSI